MTLLSFANDERRTTSDKRPTTLHPAATAKIAAYAYV
jgi:hypothetical protein